jgi:hypothetical protein
MSKRTLVYAGYATTNPDDTGDTKLWTAGMKHKF